MKKQHIQKRTRPQILDSLDSDITWAQEQLVEARRHMEFFVDKLPELRQWPENHGMSAEGLYRFLRSQGLHQRHRDMVSAVESAVGILQHSFLKHAYVPPEILSFS